MYSLKRDSKNVFCLNVDLEKCLLCLKAIYLKHPDIVKCLAFQNQTEWVNYQINPPPKKTISEKPSPTVICNSFETYPQPIFGSRFPKIKCLPVCVVFILQSPKVYSKIKKLFSGILTQARQTEGPKLYSSAIGDLYPLLACL